jgi:hypothetical protein
VKTLNRFQKAEAKRWFAIILMSGVLVALAFAPDSLFKYLGLLACLMFSVGNLLYTLHLLTLDQAVAVLEEQQKRKKEQEGK